MSIKTIGVIGSGIMGSGIAEAAAGHDFKVILRSRSISNAESMKATMEKSLAKQVEKEKITEDKKQQTLSNVKLTEDLNDLSDCDLIIESIVEDLDAKIELFRQLDSIAKKEAILATNTSTLPVVEMAIETSRPDHICGIHFFNPAPVMKLVEVVRPITASQETIDQALEFARTCEKEPVVVKDQAGFIVNALLFPYLNNAIRLAEQGVASYEDIDLAMKGGCGFPMGPFALLDLVGLDTSLAILDALYDEFKDPNFAAVPLLRRMVAANKLGRKTKQGFYTY